MFHCEHAFEGMLEGQICLGVCDEGLRPSFSPHCPLPYLLLTKACWHADATNRRGPHTGLGSRRGWGSVCEPPADATAPPSYLLSGERRLSGPAAVTGLACLITSRMAGAL